jgi:protein-S-isoprenylcysteine O-methyltransferase Ste14
MYTTLIIGWIAYFLIHSLLASNVVKDSCERHIPFIFSYYRILFNIIAIAGLIIMIHITLLDKKMLFEQSSILNITASILLLSGCIVYIIAAASFNLKEFLGFEKPTQQTQNKLVTKGIYNYVRHPLYTGTILVSFGYFLSTPTISVLLFVILAFVYIEIGSRLEEKKLLIEFGNEYAEYCNDVKRYFPFIY